MGRTALLVLAGLLLTGLAVGLGAVLVQAPPDAAESLRLVVDTDAGADDALAILELLLAERAPLTGSVLGAPRVLGITSVLGNTGVVNVTRNVFATLRAVNRTDIPVFAGASRALMPSTFNGDNFFGEDGFGDFLPPGKPLGKPQPEHAAVALVRLARENPGELTLLCLGPLTNIALAVRLDPDFLRNVKDVYIIGGVIHGVGNTQPGAEYNMYIDPEAAAIVFDAVERPFYLMPWETLADGKLPSTWRREVLGVIENDAVDLLNKAEGAVLSRNLDVWGASDGILAAHLLDDRVITSRKPGRISVLSGAPPARGVTLVDYNNFTGMPNNAVFLEEPDKVALQRLLLQLFTGA